MHPALYAWRLAATSKVSVVCCRHVMHHHIGRFYKNTTATIGVNSAILGRGINTFSVIVSEGGVNHGKVRTKGEKQAPAIVFREIVVEKNIFHIAVPDFIQIHSASIYSPTIVYIQIAQMHIDNTVHT